MLIAPSAQDMTFRVWDEPSDVGGGNFLPSSFDDYTIRGLFITPGDQRMVSTPRGDYLVGYGEVHIRKKDLDDNSISASAYRIQIIIGGETYRVIGFDDYVGSTGCYMFKVVRGGAGEDAY